MDNGKAASEGGLGLLPFIYRPRKAALNANRRIENESQTLREWARSLSPDRTPPAPNPTTGKRKASGLEHTCSAKKHPASRRQSRRVVISSSDESDSNPSSPKTKKQKVLGHQNDITKRVHKSRRSANPENRCASLRHRPESEHRVESSESDRAFVVSDEDEEDGDADYELERGDNNGTTTAQAAEEDGDTITDHEQDEIVDSIEREVRRASAPEPAGNLDSEAEDEDSETEDDSPVNKAVRRSCAAERDAAPASPPKFSTRRTTRSAAASHPSTNIDEEHRQSSASSTLLPQTRMTRSLTRAKLQTNPTLSLRSDDHAHPRASSEEPFSANQSISLPTSLPLTQKMRLLVLPLTNATKMPPTTNSNFATRHSSGNPQEEFPKTSRLILRDLVHDWMRSTFPIV